MKKGETTRLAILGNAMDYVCQFGLASISIGEVAKRMDMSRTGVISHFANKADMQIAILRHCEQVFLDQVLTPAYSPDPLEHLRQFHHNWMNWVFKLRGQNHMSCPFVKAIAEFQDQQDGPVRDVVVEQQARTLEYLASLVQACMDAGQFTSTRDPRDFAVASYSFYQGHNVSKRLLADPDADARFIAQIEALIHQYNVEE